MFEMSAVGEGEMERGREGERERERERCVGGDLSEGTCVTVSFGSTVVLAGDWSVRKT